MYGEKEKAAKAREYKHMTFYEAANLAKRGSACTDVADSLQPVSYKTGRIYGGSKTDLSRAKAARDGWTVELEFDEE